MREFFRGWPRKAGLITLAMALLLMAAWMRSHVIEDVIYGHGIGTFASYNGALCHLRTIEDYGPAALQWRAHQISESADDSEIGNAPWDGLADEWRLRFIGFAIGVFRHTGYPDNPMVHFVIIPYWSLVLPLTLFSAWLLLTKPRPAKSAKDSNHA